MGILNKIMNELGSNGATTMVSSRQLDWVTPQDAVFSFVVENTMEPANGGGIRIGEDAFVLIDGKQLAPQSSRFQEVRVIERNGKLLTSPGMKPFSLFVDDAAKKTPEELMYLVRQ